VYRESTLRRILGNGWAPVWGLPGAGALRASPATRGARRRAFAKAWKGHEVSLNSRLRCERLSSVRVSSEAVTTVFRVIHCVRFVIAAHLETQNRFCRQRRRLSRKTVGRQPQAHGPSPFSAISRVIR